MNIMNAIPAVFEICDLKKKRFIKKKKHSQYASFLLCLKAVYPSLKLSDKFFIRVFIRRKSMCKSRSLCFEAVERFPSWGFVGIEKKNVSIQSDVSASIICSLSPKSFSPACFLRVNRSIESFSPTLYCTSLSVGIMRRDKIFFALQS